MGERDGFPRDSRHAALIIKSLIRAEEKKISDIILDVRKARETVECELERLWKYLRDNYPHFYTAEDVGKISVVDAAIRIMDISRGSRSSNPTSLELTKEDGQRVRISSQSEINVEDILELGPEIDLEDTSEFKGVETVGAIKEYPNCKNCDFPMSFTSLKRWHCTNKNCSEFQGPGPYTMKRRKELSKGNWKEFNRKDTSDNAGTSDRMTQKEIEEDIQKLLVDVRQLISVGDDMLAVEAVLGNGSINWK